MGIEIGIIVSTLLNKEKWLAVYNEAFDLAKKLGLADWEETDIHGHIVRCLVPVEERKWNGKPGWWAVANYTYGDPCEGFFFPKELIKPEDNKPIDILVRRAHDIEVIDITNPGKNYECIWENKTQGHTYHLDLLAIGCLVQDRLGDDAFVNSDINAGQCREAVKRANEYLDKPISVPYQCDPNRWIERIKRITIKGIDRIRIAIDMYIGKEDVDFGEKLRSLFSHDELCSYWKEEFSEYSMRASGFGWTLEKYLEMGFDLGDLCDLINYTDEDGTDLHEKFICKVMDSKIYLKEKDCTDLLMKDPDDPALYGIGAEIIRHFASVGRIKNVDRYIAIDELRKTFREKLGSECDVDAIIDKYLEREKELNNAESFEDESEEIEYADLNRVLKKSKDRLEKLADEYDIYVEEHLQFYEQDCTIEPLIVKKICRVLEFCNTIRESDEYKKAAKKSINYKEKWLIANSEQFYGLRDRDWERIFENLEKEPKCFERYYPLFRINLNDSSVKEIVMGLVINDDLYEHALAVYSNRRD